MTKIFISYRRQDTKQIVGRIYDKLTAEFGQNSVFMDIDDIPPGVDFHTHLDKAISSARAVLVLIGPSWIEARNAGHRRLDDPNDFVRLEIEAALRRDILLVPVLIDGTPMPTQEQLPESLRPLTRRNAALVDVGRDFHAHMERLNGILEGHLGWSVAAEKRQQEAEEKSRRLTEAVQQAQEEARQALLLVTKDRPDLMIPELLAEVYRFRESK